jgi:uncharacterized membrane protein
MMHWFSYAVLSAGLTGLVPIFGKVGVGGTDSTLATTMLYHLKKLDNLRRPS